MAEPARPYTPDQLAERWGCSGETVRSLIRTGKLSAFRVGRMMRITQATVEEYESCGTIESGDSRGALSSCGMTTTEPGDVIALRHTRQKRPSEKPETPSSSTLPQGRA
ncbi:DNA-binding protein [Paracoccus onubensis]|uniref:DNA-binding protein n=1 Tax=Paracoccus onubensis TaxID=1675788 RepID=A0A418SPV4_9RHOB|nr:DNA-binding protein [Paracoccus onubensis]